MKWICTKNHSIFLYEQKEKANYRQIIVQKGTKRVHLVVPENAQNVAIAGYWNAHI